MALSLPNATIDMALILHERIHEGFKPGADEPIHENEVHDMLDYALKEAHLIAVGLSVNRLVTVEEMAEITGISLSLIKERIALSRVQPLKTLGRHAIYAYEDIPHVVYAHLENTETVEYIPARIRMALRRARSARSIKALKTRDNIAGFNKTGERVRICFDIDPIDAGIIDEECKADGWPSRDVFFRGLITSYLETFGDITKLRRKKKEEQQDA